MKFPRVSCKIADLLEILGHCLDVTSNRSAKLVPTVSVGHESCLFDTTRRAAQRRRSKGLSESHPFASQAVRLLTDDELWWGQNQAALSSQRAWGWADAAAALEALIP